jgi:acetyltransferase
LVNKPASAKSIIITMNTFNPSSPENALPYPDFGTYPTTMNPEEVVKIKGFGNLLFRPIRLADEKEMIDFHKRVSDESIYMRYFEHLSLEQRTDHERLVRICRNTSDFYAIVLEKQAGDSEKAAIMAVGRLTKTSEPYVATFDPLMTDAAHTPKIAKILLERLVELTRAFGFRTLTGEVLVADHEAVNLCRSLGFSIHTVPEGGLVDVSLSL